MTQHTSQTTAQQRGPIQRGIQLSHNDAERSSAIPFILGVLGYLAAVPLLAITLSAVNMA